MKHGCKIDFEEDHVSDKVGRPTKIQFSQTEEVIIEEQLSMLLKQRVIEITEQSPDQVLSNIFLRQKKDGSHRLILNLKPLNQYVRKQHFKMETLKHVLTMIKPNAWFASIDLRQAYYSVPVHKDYKKYLRFIFKNVCYAFTVLPFGLSSSPRLFTKMLKPVFSTLRKSGHSNATYIDDSFLQGDTKTACKLNIEDTMNLVDDLGFTVNVEKSILKPTQCIAFIGFLLNSLDMTVRLTPQKREDIKECCKSALKANTLSIRDFARVIGKLVASEQGVQYAGLYYKQLEIEKDTALKINKGNFEAKISISNKCRNCLLWWIENVDSACRLIQLPNPVIVIESDSSNYGWGGYDKTNNVTVSGLWLNEDKIHHINYLELKAAYLALQFLCEQIRNAHVHLFLDNTVAIKYISKMGGRVTELNDLTQDIWKWCEKRKIILSAFHIPGVENVTADKLSRLTSTDMEWAIRDDIFELFMTKFEVMCDIDLFASRFNKKLPKYASFTPDPEAYAVNAFSLNWNNFKCVYIFPPFSLIAAILQKIDSEKTTAVLVAPLFTTQVWFPRLLKMICKQSYLLPPSTQILINSKYPEKEHPLDQMRLAAFLISGQSSLVMDYQKKLPTCSYRHGNYQHVNSISRITKSGCSFVVHGKLIDLIPI